MSAGMPATSREPDIPRRLLLTIAVAAIVSVAIVSITAFSLVPLKPVIPRIVSVSASPNPGLPNEYITVEAVVESETGSGHPSVSLALEACYAMSISSGESMRRVDGNRYVTQIGPFNDGTEVWLVVAAYGTRGARAVNSTLSVSVGNVTKGGPSGLGISRVDHTPLGPTVSDTVVVTATVPSSSNIREVRLLFAYMSAGHLGSGSLDMVSFSSHVFTAEIDDAFIYGYVFERGTVFIYRIAAIDVTANTAMSETKSFTWS